MVRDVITSLLDVFGEEEASFIDRKIFFSFSLSPLPAICTSDKRAKSTESDRKKKKRRKRRRDESSKSAVKVWETILPQRMQVHFKMKSLWWSKKCKCEQSMNWFTVCVLEPQRKKNAKGEEIRVKQRRHQEEKVCWWEKKCEKVTSTLW